MQKDKRGNEKLNTEIKNVLSAADDKAQYDAYAKKLIAQKSILANILVKTVGAFKGMDPKDVVSEVTITDANGSKVNATICNLENPTVYCLRCRVQMPPYRFPMRKI